MGQENPLCCEAPGARNGFGPGLVAICSSLPRPFHPLWLWGTASCVCMSPPAALWAAALLCGRGPGSAGAAESRLGAAPGTGITGIAPCPATAPGGPPCPGALPQFPHRILQQRLPLPKGHWGSGGGHPFRQGIAIHPAVRQDLFPTTSRGEGSPHHPPPCCQGTILILLAITTETRGGEGPFPWRPRRHPSCFPSGTRARGDSLGTHREGTPTSPHPPATTKRTH